MIEVNRQLYLDEANGTPSEGFDVCRLKLANVMSAVIKGAV